MKILIVDDEKSICFALTELFKNEGFESFSVNTFDECLNIIKKEYFEIVILDYQLKDKNGLELLTIIKKESPATQIIFITAFGNENIAIKAIKNGAYDYVKKPFDNEELINRVNHIKDALTIKSNENDNENGYFFSPKMTAIAENIKTIAKTSVPVMICGESGTGKEVIARLIHKYSERSGKFTAVNCGAIPANLMESELFGSEKGSFTGSNERKTGFFETANNGTIFLDEIAETNQDMQIKLLRVLQEYEIIRLGSSTPVKINSRVISATNKNINDAISSGIFREDLYYRLNLITIEIPPLRERKEEIKPLAEAFLTLFNKKYDKKIIGFENLVLNCLINYTWTGNVRELKNTIEKAVIFCKTDWISSNDIDLKTNDKKCFENEVSDLSLHYNFNELPENLTKAKKIISAEFEKDFIKYYLEKNNGVISKTADLIGLHRQDLYKKLKEKK